ncbi:MAG: O-antigen polymerase [Acidimicrobiales bacterium]
MSVALAVLVMAIPSAVAYWIHRWVHAGRVGLTPLAALSSAWVVSLTLFLVNPLGLLRPHLYTWLLVVGSLGSFTVGYGTAIISGAKTAVRPREWTPFDLDSDRALVALWRGAVVWFVAFFTVFVRSLITNYRGYLTPSRFGAMLVQLRQQIGAGQRNIGLYYFYAAELLVPLGLLLYLDGRPRRLRYLVVSGVALASLPLTSGRTNFVDAIVWAAAMVLLRRTDRRIGRRTVAALAGTVVAVVASFVVFGTVIGKTFNNDVELRQLLPRTAHLPAVGLYLPYFYVSAPIAGLERTVEHGPPSPDAHHGSTHLSSIRPVFQILNIADPSMHVPAKIQPFQRVPYQFNLATAIQPLYDDWGTSGLLVACALLGLGCGAVYAAWARSPSPASLLLVALCIGGCVRSVIDLSPNDLSVWLQVAALVAVMRAERRIEAPRSFNSADSGFDRLGPSAGSLS